MEDTLLEDVANCHRKYDHWKIFFVTESTTDSKTDASFFLQRALDFLFSFFFVSLLNFEHRAKIS